MNVVETGGVAAVSIGIPDILIVIVGVAVLFGVWKVAKLLWAALAG